MVPLVCALLPAAHAFTLSATPRGKIRSREPLMQTPAEAQAQMDALAQQIQMLQLQQQIAALQQKSSQAATPAAAPAPIVEPTVATPPAPVAIAEAVATPPAPVALPEPVAMPPVPVPVAIPEAVATPPAPLVRDPVEVQAQMDAVAQKIQMLQLQEQIAQMQKMQAAATPTVVPPPIAAAESAAVVAPPPAALALPDIVIAPPAALAVPEAAVDAVSASWDNLNVVGVLAAVALLPVGYFGATKVAEFVNSRYDELQGDGTAAAAEGPLGPPTSFAPRAPGNAYANQLWAQRQADLEVARASNWEGAPAYVSGTRDAKDIFAAGLSNLLQEPTGWFFGQPSALYSNAAAPPAPLDATPTAATPVATPVAAAPVAATPVAAPVAAPITPPVAPQPVVPSVAPSPAAPAASPAASGVMPPAAMPTASGRVVPSGSKAMLKSSRRASRAARRAERVPPSTPEEVASARAGEYDYGQSE